MSESQKPSTKPPGLYRNFISFIGAAIAIASFVSILFLFLVELTGDSKNPYLGIFTYIMFPSVMVGGIMIVFVGMFFERRRRRKNIELNIPAYPTLDLNDPHRRRSLVVFLGVTFLFVFMSSYGSYRAFEFTESVQFCGQTCHEVMNPEFVAYKASAHARVRCVECHVGAGADWYVKSKLSGAYQLYSVTFRKFHRPIGSPVHNLRPAQDTCEQCHWPEKFFGAQLKIFSHYGYDEKNSLRQARVLINVGGGGSNASQVQGIHWHMNIANEITYIAQDEHRQVIPWVRAKDKLGNVTEYFARDNQLSPQQIQGGEQRRMDCVDCHNRPTHVYVPPDRAVNESFAAHKLDTSLPYLKREAVELLTRPYRTNDEAVNNIGSSLDRFYQNNYPDLYAQQSQSIKGSIAEVQRIYQTYLFPEMKVNWQTHPDNIGHYYSQGCFRCHDGQHVSKDGRTIRNDCNICHTVLDQTDGGNPVAIENGSFKHPLALGDLGDRKCAACHTGGGAFKHPVNLGNLSEFQCADCHTGKKMKKES